MTNPKSEEYFTTQRVQLEKDLYTNLDIFKKELDEWNQLDRSSFKEQDLQITADFKEIYRMMLCIIETLLKHKQLVTAWLIFEIAVMIHHGMMNRIQSLAYIASLMHTGLEIINIELLDSIEQIPPRNKLN